MKTSCSLKQLSFSDIYRDFCLELFKNLLTQCIQCYQRRQCHLFNTLQAQSFFSPSMSLIPMLNNFLTATFQWVVIVHVQIKRLWMWLWPLAAATNVEGYRSFQHNFAWPMPRRSIQTWQHIHLFCINNIFLVNESKTS